jgi:hypothetical protein
VTASGLGAVVWLTDSPIYLTPVGRNRVLEAAATWGRLALETVVSYGPSATIRAASPSGMTSRTVQLERTADGIPVRLEMHVAGAAPLVQETIVIVRDPLVVTVGPPYGNQAKVTVANPSGAAFDGTLVVTSKRAGSTTTRRLPLRLRAGQTHLALQVSTPSPRTGRMAFTGEVLDHQGARVLTLPPCEFARVTAFSRDRLGAAPTGFRVDPDGDAKVASEQSIALQDPPHGPAAPGLRSVKLMYRFAKGWKFVTIRPTADALRAIQGKPREFGVWIHGDGQGNVPRLRFVDSTGQTWQPDGEPITWKGWQWVTFALDGTRCGRWGGADDGVIHYPIRWEALFLLDSAGGHATEGEVYIAGPTLIY